MGKIKTNFIRLNAVIQMTSLSKSTIYRMEKQNKFPRRRRLGCRAVAWVYTEVEDWVQSKIDQR